ncbi:MAG: phenylalanine--tRNA ligase subunit beta [Candidatus Krumholzibacteriia bacterium]
MKISLDWLRDLVSWDAAPDELAHRLTMAGLNVEGLHEIRLEFPGVVVGRVVGCQRHPDADRLSICRVEDGSGETVPVVCGAPNVREGLSVLFARVGADLPNGLRIKKTRIRGQESHGMICSAVEVGLGEESSGIVELDTTAVPGTPADDLYGFRDVVLDVEVTPNRPDWLSHLGVAREVAAIFGNPLTPPPVWTPQPTAASAGVKVEIESFADCRRYTAHVARELKLGPSPRAMQNRLRALGARPINNVVDITNYVMFELGQPLHAFDLATIEGARIVVRRMGAPGTVVTLDGAERSLLAGDLVIADAERPVAIAGVMGLASSEVGENTTDLLLESAFFSPALVRATSRRLGLVSESSYRFEREADWDMVERAARRALYLIQEHAGARIVADRVDRTDPDRRPAEPVPLRTYQLNRLLGTELSTGAAADLLQSLGLNVQPMGNPNSHTSQAVNMMVQPPSFRRDLQREVDLIEEIARRHGYDQLRGDGLFRGSFAGRRRPQDRRNDALRSYLAAAGYVEILTSTFMPADAPDRLLLDAGDRRRRTLSVRNARHGGDVVLRTTLLPSLLEVARRNLNTGAAVPARFFQINRAFLPVAEPRPDARHPGEERLPDEPLVLQLGIAGWREDGLGGVPADLLEIKGMLNELAALLRVEARAVPAPAEPYLAAGRQWRLEDANGTVLGAAGRIDPSVAERFDLEHPLAVAEIVLDRLPTAREPVRFQPFARYPAVKRDLSLLVPEGVTYGSVVATLRAHAGPHLESVELFDFYRGKELGAVHAALGIRLKFRSTKGNLKGETIDRTIADVQAALEREHDIRLRG